MSSRLNRAATRVAITTRHRGADHPETVDARVALIEARAQEADAALREHIRRLVDSAPPLTEAQRARLAALLRPEVPVG